MAQSNTKVFFFTMFETNTDVIMNQIINNSLLALFKCCKIRKYQIVFLFNFILRV